MRIVLLDIRKVYLDYVSQLVPHKPVLLNISKFRLVFVYQLQPHNL